MIATQKAPKRIIPRGPDTKYTGDEPTWDLQPTEERKSALTQAFGWYNYYCSKTDAKTFLLDWLERSDQRAEARAWKSVPEQAISPTIGWLARMNTMGLTLSTHEQSQLTTAVRQLLDAHRPVKAPVVKEETAVIKPNIQDHLRERARECAAEIDSMFDDFVIAGAKLTADTKPIAMIRGMNISPQMVNIVADVWRRRLEEYEQVVAGKDAQLVEGYSNFSKIQMRNVVKFAEQVIADCGSYVQIKKVERKPRKVKAVPPEKRAAKFKLQAEFAELSLKSLPAAQLVDKSEAWIYDTKKRKLIHLVADTHVGNFTVKNNNIIGFSATDSVQKTLRKPADQLKALMAASVPVARKLFKDIKATETKFNGRGSENLILLKIK
jgi:hypothetical protein